MDPERKKRVLFVGEAVTLSHVVRPAVLAKSLDPDHYDVVLACDPRYNALLPTLPFPTVALSSAIDADRLLEILAGPAPIFEVEDIDRYVGEDLRLIEEHSPDLIVGDMRQSLAISSHVKRIPYLNIIGAQWSPYTSVEIEPLEPPLAQVLSESIGQSLFKTFIATAGSVHHSIPVNVVRVKHGLPPLSWDARHIYSAGDYVAYPDIPEIIPTTNLPSHHSYLGPILWSPEVKLPEWWHELPEDRPVVYVNLGSSGRKDLLNEVLSGLSDLKVTVIAATTGSEPDVKPSNAFFADYLPGSACAARSRVVICNGGGMPVQQALAAGVPVIGLVSNMDQLMFSRAVHRTGAGEVIREKSVTAAEIRRLVWRLIAVDRYRERAQWIATRYKEFDAASRFQDLVSRIIV